MRVAFATHDLKLVNAHFAGARTMVVYDVTAEGHRFLEAVQFDGGSAEDGVHSDTEDRIAPRLAALAGCAMVFVTGIGGPTAARVVNSRIHPVKLPREEPIVQVLERLEKSLRGTPPPWMRKLLQTAEAAEPVASQAQA